MIITQPSLTQLVCLVGGTVQLYAFAGKGHYYTILSCRLRTVYNTGGRGAYAVNGYIMILWLKRLFQSLNHNASHNLIRAKIIVWHQLLVPRGTWCHRCNLFSH